MRFLNLYHENSKCVNLFNHVVYIFCVNSLLIFQIESFGIIFLHDSHFDLISLSFIGEVNKLQLLLKPMMLRRLKEDVEKSIAPKEETVVEVELTNIQKKYYRGILEKNFSFLSKGTTSANVPNLMNTMMELRKCCIHPYLLNGELT